MIKPYLEAFGYAFEGIASFFKSERNAKVHAVAAIAVIIAGFFFDFTPTEWLWVSSAIFSVIITEMINTAIEKLCNRITLDQDPEIKVIKDVAAGFVLMASFYALIVAAIILYPYTFN